MEENPFVFRMNELKMQSMINQDDGLLKIERGFNMFNRRC